MHGGNRRVKTSDYKVRLLEKQKIRWHYGVLERQFVRYIREASRQRGPTGRNLVNLLERRLDNVVWRLGLAPTIPAARQLVVHGHITVEGRRVDRPSYSVSVNQTVAVREAARQKPFIQQAVEQGLTRTTPDYLEFDPAKVSGQMTRDPEAEDLPLSVNLQAIIEFYSQKL